VAVAAQQDRADGTWPLRVTKWGRWTAATLTVTVRDRSRLWHAVARFSVGEVIVYPDPAALRRLLSPAVLPTRIGMHTARAIGTGVEFAGIRGGAPGDPLRDINWPATLRRGRPRELLVTQRVADRAADVIVALDAFSDVAGSLDRSVRGCAGLAQAHLRAGDRVGLIVLGGALHWLPPDTGQRTYYRVAEAVLAVRRDETVVTPDISRVPREALPPTALVIVFTPLLDDRTITTLQDLRLRGVSAGVLDVLTVEPVPSQRRRSRLRAHRRGGTGEDLALRLWRLDREALRHRLSHSGIAMLHWDGRHALDEILLPQAQQTFARRPR
jgi:uncharacterized protein (DUF58 family)